MRPTRAPVLGAFSALLLLAPVAAESYNVVKEYIGPTFFNDWTFYDHYDNLTNGDAIFVSASVGASEKLAYVDSTTNHAIIKVDNTTNVPFNEKRNTVRIATNERYAVGSVWVADIHHVPYGCSVWPAWWSQAPAWPEGGEIDTFEGVNLVTHNQLGLHTLPGCTIDNPAVATTSKLESTDCSYLTNSNQGCLVVDQRPVSYGEAFAQAGGGVFVTEFATSGISIWFFSRADVPDSLKTNTASIDTASLGTPTGNWPSTQCDLNQFFEPQNLIFDVTLCGDFAGPPEIFSQTCTGVCYNDYVIGDGSNFGTAYFDIASVRVYGKDSSVVIGGSGGNGTGATNGVTGDGAVAMEGAWAAMGLVGLVQIWMFFA